MKNYPLKERIAQRIKRSKKEVFLRSDFSDFAGYDQVGRALKQLVNDQLIIRIGQGLYTRARISSVTGGPTIALPGGFKSASRAALTRLGYKWTANKFEDSYNCAQTTQIPANAEVVVQGRLSRKIEFGNQELQYRVKH